MDEELVRDLEGAMTPEASPTSDTVRTSWQKRAEEAGAAQQRHHDEAGTAAVLSRLADSATALVSVIQELAQQGASWRKSAGEQLDGLTGRYDELAEVVFGQQLINAVAQERYEEVCSAIATSREAHARHESDVVSLREGARERMDWFAGRVDEMAGQLGQHREHVSELEARVNGLEHLHSTVGDLSSRVQSWCERLDKQGEVLHALCEAHNQRSVVLDQFLEVLTRLRSGSVTAPEKL